ncbi:MAG TPA: hypothetical protein VIH46_02045 [Candidatus Acidoferrales bacterium]
MVRKFVVCASLAGMMLLGASGRAYSAPAQSQNNQQSADAQTVSGKVAAIGSDHKSFSLEVSGGNTMQFLLDNNTQVQGRVTTGTTATVQYQKTDDGKLLALSIAPQNPGQSPQ